MGQSVSSESTAASPEVSATIPDWSREYKSFWAWHPSRSLLASIRAYDRSRQGRGVLRVFARKLAALRHFFWTLVTGADIPLGCQIGGGLLLTHPNGVVIHPQAIIGPNCLIFQQVTVGMGRDGVPVIGGHVDIGAGAKVIGKIVVGDHAMIGANAVVVHDVEAGSTVVGIPARKVKPKS